MTEQLWDMKTSGLGPGTHVETTEGPVPIEWLSTTHRVVTRDNGPQPVLAVDKHILRPLDGAYVPLVTVAPDAIGDGEPDHPLILPPHHRLLLEGPDIALHFGTDAALCHVGHLVDGHAVKRVNAGDAVAFYSVLTPSHEVIRANCVWVESVMADVGCELVSLDTLSPAIFAQLNLQDGAHRPAHTCLADWEGRLLARHRNPARKWAFAQVA